MFLTPSHRSPYHTQHVYDPADLVEVALGRTGRWALQAARRWAVSYPGQPDPLPGWTDGPPQMVVGSA